MNEKDLQSTIDLISEAIETLNYGINMGASYVAIWRIRESLDFLYKVQVHLLDDKASSQTK